MTGATSLNPNDVEAQPEGQRLVYVYLSYLIHCFPQLLRNTHRAVQFSAGATKEMPMAMTKRNGNAKVRIPWLSYSSRRLETIQSC